MRGKITVSGYTMVEANTIEEARAVAIGRPVELCPTGDPASRGTTAWESVIVENGDGDFDATDVEPTDEDPEYFDDESDDEED